MASVTVHECSINWTKPTQPTQFGAAARLLNITAAVGQMLVFFVRGALGQNTAIYTGLG